MDKELGDVREIRIGTPIRAAFCSISELMRPVVIRIRFSGETFCLNHSPAILSSVLCRPISSADNSTCSPSLSAEV